MKTSKQTTTEKKHILHDDESFSGSFTQLKSVTNSDGLQQ